jgi:hypothetical protein
MKRRPGFILLAAATALGVITAGCETAPKQASAVASAPVTTSAPGTAAPAAAASAQDSQKAWASVLSRFVDSDGKIDFGGLARDRKDLDAYVAWIGRVSPGRNPAGFPNNDGKLTYYINAYNALAMWNVLKTGIPKDLNAVRARFYTQSSLEVGGEKMSLDEIENKLIRPIGDPRAHFALNGMARGYPRLPREPFRADLLQMELEAVGQFFLSSDRNAQVDADRHTVRFSQLLEFHTEDFLTKAPSLPAYANKFREAKIPEGYRVEFIPFDWTLNAK